MSRIATALRAVVAALEARQVRFALVGGLAVSARAEPRFTRDVDLAVAVENDEQAEALVHSLVTAGYTIITAVEQDQTKRLATVRLLPPGEHEHGVVVDLLFASSGIEPELVEAAEPTEILPGMEVPLATLGCLMAMKLLSEDAQRPQDSVDLLHLSQVATEDDLQEASRALALIQSRGFARNKDLARELQRLREGLKRSP
jgi:predicted nucleotidyltransferase